MEFHKVIDNDFLQVYHIKHPNDEWKKKFKEPTVIVSYNPDNRLVKIRNTNKIFDWRLISDLSYVFTTSPESVIKNAFKKIPLPDGINVNKKCGFNGTVPEIFSNKHDIVLTAFSMSEEEYSPLMLYESFSMVTNKEELKSNGSNLMKIINKVIRSRMRKKYSFVDFVSNLGKSFPLNYMVTLRRFYSVITEKDLDPNNMVKDVNFYIGYDCRYGTTITENELSKHMETILYKPGDIIYVYETYDNPMKKIIENCKQKNIKYKELHKHCISMSYKDYCNLQLVSRISDFM